MLKAYEIQNFIFLLRLNFQILRNLRVNIYFVVRNFDIFFIVSYDQCSHITSDCTIREANGRKNEFEITF